MAVEFAESNDGYESQFQVIISHHFSVSMRSTNTTKTNYLSHWLLTDILLPLLLRTAANEAPGAVRIINVTSIGHNLFAPKTGIDFADMKQIAGSPWSRYGMSKLANILHTKELHRRYGPGSSVESRQARANFPPSATPPATGEIWVASAHPGSVDT